VSREDRWKEIIRQYLSTEHCDRPDTGCPLAALAPEIARAKISVRKRIAGQMKEWVEFMPGVTATEQERNFFVIFSAIAGAVSIARILTEPADRQKVLASMRDHLLRSF
jgi:TetR/AcrR family transcriptional regulator, transcriptional repressor for nem operon